MTYANGQYINVARNNELQHHERTMTRFRRQIAQLNKAVAWELEQHQIRLKELQQLEEGITGESSLTSSASQPPTLEPVPSCGRRWTQTRKYIHRSLHQPMTQLVS